MIRLNVLELLEKEGKTKYWLYKQLGMSYHNFNRMIHNETKSIRYENIETLCLLLHCTPNELFVITEDEPKYKAPKRTSSSVLFSLF
ncbi:MAG: helix-turn-helix transcriptional regulator [Ruminococcaceae bacterium]|nr:helix-turn-helix transcriptional regulator [Oscillospiraceae bacterium]